MRARKEIHQKMLQVLLRRVSEWLYYNIAAFENNVLFLIAHFLKSGIVLISAPLLPNANSLPQCS